MTPLLPAVAKERADGTVLMSFGDPAKGPHEQFDFQGSIQLAEAIAAAYSDCHAPDGEVSRLRGAMKADDERLRLAAARAGIHAGCDAPEMMADEIQRLRSDSGYVTGFNDGFEHAKKTSLMIMEENSAFAIGDLVRKKSGSWWEGRVVGFYSTEQTPDGVCVQLDKPMGPVQIYPASALELVEQSGTPEHGSEVLQQFADPVEPPPPWSHVAPEAGRVFADPCVQKLAEDEPFFVLLGRDVDASQALSTWITLRLRSEGRTPKVRAAERTLDAFSDYRDALATTEGSEG